MTANQKKDGSSTASATGNTPKKAKGRPRKPKAETGDSAELVFELYFFIDIMKYFTQSMFLN